MAQGLIYRSLSNQRSDIMQEAPRLSHVGSMSRRAKMIDFYTKCLASWSAMARRRPHHLLSATQRSHQVVLVRAVPPTPRRDGQQCRSMSQPRQCPARLPQDRDAGCEARPTARQAVGLFPGPEATRSRCSATRRVCAAALASKIDSTSEDELYRETEANCRLAGSSIENGARISKKSRHSSTRERINQRRFA